MTTTDPLSANYDVRLFQRENWERRFPILIKRDKNIGREKGKQRLTKRGRQYKPQKIFLENLSEHFIISLDFIALRFYTVYNSKCHDLHFSLFNVCWYPTLIWYWCPYINLADSQHVHKCDVYIKYTQDNKIIIYYYYNCNKNQ